MTSSILTDFVSLDEFAREIGRDPRTIRNWMDAPDGLPFTRLGSRRLVHLPTAKDWLLSKMTRPNPRRA